MHLTNTMLKVRVYAYMEQELRNSSGVTQVGFPHQSRQMFPQSSLN